MVFHIQNAIFWQTYKMIQLSNTCARESHPQMLCVITWRKTFSLNCKLLWLEIHCTTFVFHTQSSSSTTSSRSSIRWICPVQQKRCLFQYLGPDMNMQAITYMCSTQLIKVMGISSSLLMKRSWTSKTWCVTLSWWSSGSFWLPNGGSWGHFGSNLGVLGIDFGSSLGVLEAILAPTWGSWGSFWLQVGGCGPSWLQVRCPGTILPPCWGILRPSWLQIGGSWDHFGSKLANLGPSWLRPGGSWGHFGSNLGDLGANLGDLGANLGDLGATLLQNLGWSWLLCAILLNPRKLKKTLGFF